MQCMSKLGLHLNIRSLLCMHSPTGEQHYAVAVTNNDVEGSQISVPRSSISYLPTSAGLP